MGRGCPWLEVRTQRGCLCLPPSRRLEAASVTAVDWDEEGSKKPQASGLKESSSSRNQHY